MLYDQPEAPPSQQALLLLEPNFLRSNRTYVGSAHGQLVCPHVLSHLHPGGTGGGAGGGEGGGGEGGGGDYGDSQ